MFDFIGRIMILQPDAALPFVAGPEEQHPMLPAGPGLYMVQDPSPFTAAPVTVPPAGVLYTSGIMLCP